MTIFVSIASYRDAELIPTVRSCLDQADAPDDLRIVINWQHLDGESIDELRDDPRIEIIDFPASASQGACWARAQITRRYAGEQFYCQVDSHTRFATGWDRRAKQMLALTGADKPILSTYPPTYTPHEQFDGAGEPCRLVVRTFDNGLPVFEPRPIPDWQLLSRPPRARFLAAGFIFAVGSFAREVPYDPDLYFVGEEITMSLRAYTFGYDFFHPHEVLAWHYYIREDGPRHWEDHQGDDRTQRPWWVRDRTSRRRARNLLLNPSVRYLNCGPDRPPGEYETYSGLDFRAETCTAEANCGDEPRAVAGHVAG